MTPRLRRPRFWPEDTIAWRYALTIVLTIALAVTLVAMVVALSGVWGRPPAKAYRNLARADDIVRMVEAAPAGDRQSLARAVDNSEFLVGWYPAMSAAAAIFKAASDLPAADDVPGFKPGRRPHRLVPTSDSWGDPLVFRLDGRSRPALYFRSNDRSAGFADLYSDPPDHSNAHFLAVGLRDGSWVVFTAPRRFWGLDPVARIGLQLVLLAISVIGVSALATYHLARPIKAFTNALRRFGAEPRVKPIPETGPRELRESIRAFNAMQAQIQTFVDDRTAMLAAISHDLRTPLTKMRLRGEFVEDPEQKARLFRDVDEMQAMIDAALAFFRDDFEEEEATSFDFPEMLRTIIDDCADRGFEVTCSGADHIAFRGRPFALKRAFTNLVDNAVKYGRTPHLEFRLAHQRIEVLVRDRGPGIPPEALERVFAPFYRLERSRNRATGGVGLGLTSARSVFRAHGGDVTLHNCPGGGLEAAVTLPFPP